MFHSSAGVRTWIALTLAGLLALPACSDDGNTPTSSGPSLARQAAPPSGVITAAVGGDNATFWPYTGTDFSGTPQDPINLIFTGQADPRAIRQALMALDGDRSSLGLPPVAPFDCRWSDAIGGSQTAWADAAGWSGSAVQLACGDYGPIRFHLRLFRAGGLTLGGAHFEVLIPGTADHQVLSWELAEQLVAGDLVRTGLLGAPPSQSGGINTAPFRTIPTAIWNPLPPELKALVGGGPDNATVDVPIGTDGRATVLDIAKAVELVPGAWSQGFTIAYGQLVPKPFCAPGPASFINISGPVHLTQRSTLGGDGELHSEFHADGQLDLQLIDLSSGSPVPVGSPYSAEVSETMKSAINDRGSRVLHLQHQAELPRTGPERGQLDTKLMVGPGDVTDFSARVVCGR